MLYLTKRGKCAMDDELFTVAQAAQYLQVCEKTVRRLINANSLIASRIGGRSLRIKKSDIEHYLSSHENRPKGDAGDE